MLCSSSGASGRRRRRGVFELAEAGLGLGLGPVAGDYLGDGPVVMVGDQHVLAEHVLFQGGAGVRVDAPGEPQVLGLLPSSCQVMTRRTEGLRVIVSISASTFWRGRRGLPRARRPQSLSLRRPWPRRRR